MKRLWLGMALLACATSANAGFFTGNDLMARSDAWDRFSRDDRGTGGYEVAVRAGEFVGYLQGFVDMAVRKQVCIKEAITLRQVVLIAQNYLRAHPEQLTTDADDLMLSAFMEAYPCPKQR